MNLTPDAFRIKIASPKEKSEIIKRMISQKRQTMNLRLMPNAILFLIEDRANKLIGWAGMDYENKKFPEMFSLFILPNYRGYQLGFALTQARSALLHQLHFSKAFIRMEASHNKSLIDYNLQTGIYRLLSSDELNFSWSNQCTLCELYGNACKSQVYLEMDIHKALQKYNKKLGILVNCDFPKMLSIEDGASGLELTWKKHHE